MEVWKIIFLSKWMICRFHVNLPGCIYPVYTQQFMLYSSLPFHKKHFLIYTQPYTKPFPRTCLLRKSKPLKHHPVVETFPGTSVLAVFSLIKRSKYCHGTVAKMVKSQLLTVNCVQDLSLLRKTRSEVVKWNKGNIDMYIYIHIHVYVYIYYIYHSPIWRSEVCWGSLTATVRWGGVSKSKPYEWGFFGVVFSRLCKKCLFGVGFSFISPLFWSPSFTSWSAMSHHFPYI